MTSFDFLKIPRHREPTQPRSLRTGHFNEYVDTLRTTEAQREAKRCMDCGIPLCNFGCPTFNLIPEFNEAVTRDEWKRAWEALIPTNPFPEITGRVCPAPCEPACCLNLTAQPVSIKAIERAIGDRAWQEGWIAPIGAMRGSLETPRKLHRAGGGQAQVAIVGSGPCGLTAAASLAQSGCAVSVFERAETPGGLLTFGIPDFKLPKDLVGRRIQWLQESGVQFFTGCEVGKDIGLEVLFRDFDAICLATGFETPRQLRVSGTTKSGVVQAMDYLIAQNRAYAQGTESHLSAQGLEVVIIGGGDTALDCIGTALRQGARRVTQITSRDTTPVTRPADNPWPEPPRTGRSDSQTEEVPVVLNRMHCAEITGSDSVTAIRCQRVLHRWEKHWNKGYEDIIVPAQMVIIAQGFKAPGLEEVLDEIGLHHHKGQLRTNGAVTSHPKVFAGGDLVVGPSLVVTAIRSGIEMARAAANYLERHQVSLGETLGR
jgi:glutamate synthase (NADPH/NADH) small chain